MLSELSNTFDHKETSTDSVSEFKRPSKWRRYPTNNRPWLYLRKFTLGSLVGMVTSIISFQKNQTGVSLWPTRLTRHSLGVIIIRNTSERIRLIDRWRRLLLMYRKPNANNVRIRVAIKLTRELTRHLLNLVRNHFRPFSQKLNDSHVFRNGRGNWKFAYVQDCPESRVLAEDKSLNMSEVPSFAWGKKIH